MTTGDNLPKLTSISLEISEVQTECFVWKIPKTNRLGGLVKFVGIYRRGSAGKHDAIYISHIVNLFYNSNRVSGLILDFRLLDYRGGDDLQVNPPQWRVLNYPIRVIIPIEAEKPECYDAYRYIMDNNITRIDISEAFQDIRMHYQV